MALKETALKTVATLFGISPNASLPELVQLLNEHLHLGLKIDERPVTDEVASIELVELAELAKAEIDGHQPGVKFYRVRAGEGAASLAAFIVVRR